MLGDGKPARHDSIISGPKKNASRWHLLRFSPVSLNTRRKPVRISRSVPNSPLADSTRRLAWAAPKNER